MPAINDPTYLRRLALFRGMALDDLGVLNGLMRRHVLPNGARTLLAEQLEDTNYIVHSGVVRIVVEQADGSELIVAVLGPGDVIGAVTVGESPTGMYSILPLDETSLFWIDRAAFETCLEKMPELSRNLSAVLARQVRMANERIEALAGMDVRTRLVRHLLLLAHEFGESPLGGPMNGCVRIPLRLTQSDLGRLIGASRVRVNQAVAEFTRRGIVKQDADRCLVISDMTTLAQMR